MSNKRKGMTAFAPAFGLIFGAGAGLITAILASWNIAISLSIGAGLGLIIGLAVYSIVKDRHN